jgi:hypothetical protein
MWGSVHRCVHTYMYSHNQTNPHTPPQSQKKNQQAKIIEEARRAERVERLQEGINEFCVAGEWRRTPYAPRQYEAIQTYVPGMWGCIWVCIWVCMGVGCFIHIYIRIILLPSDSMPWLTHTHIYIYVYAYILPHKNNKPTGADGHTEAECEAYLATHLDGFLGTFELLHMYICVCAFM